MRVQLLGLPLRSHNRLKDNLEKWSGTAGVQLRLVPSFHKEAPQIDSRLMSRVDQNVQDGFVRIIVVPTPSWKNVRKRFKFDCRVALLPFREHPLDVSWETLQTALDSVIVIEKAWSVEIGPTDLRHALLLPPPSFLATRSVNDFWNRCDVYMRLDHVTEAATLLGEVDRHHRRPAKPGQCWKDTSGVRFKWDRARHGRSNEERFGKKRFRFCFEITTGFHFDVDTESGDAFWKSDAGGARYKATHMNIDPWGNIRQ